MTLTKKLRDGRKSCTVQGFRDWCAEKRPNAPAMVAEMALAHSAGTATERAYLRTDLLDMRRLLTTAWADYPSGQPGNVVQIKARAALVTA